MIMFNPQCSDCIYHNKDKLSCKAFPKGIPNKVAFNDIIHDRILPDQEGDYTHKTADEISKESKTIVIDSEENDDWMKKLPGYKNEISTIESIGAGNGKETPNTRS